MVFYDSALAEVICESMQVGEIKKLERRLS